MSYRTDPIRKQAMQNAQPNQSTIRCVTRRSILAALARQEQEERELLHRFRINLSNRSK